MPSNADEHIPSNDEIVSGFRSEAYAVYLMDPTRQRGQTGVASMPLARKMGSQKADRAAQRLDAADAANKLCDQYKAQFMDKIEQCAGTHSIDVDILTKLFIAGRGGASEVYTIGRELEYRHEVQRKLATGSIQRTDPNYSRLMKGIDPLVEEVEFVCSDDVAWNRPDMMPNQGMWTTQNLSKGKTITWGRTKLTSAEQHEDGRGKGEPRPWKSMNRDLVELVASAVPFFKSYMSYKQGALKEARNDRNTIVREFKTFIGTVPQRRPDAPRENAKREKPPSIVPRMAVLCGTRPAIDSGAAHDPLSQLHAEDFKQFAYKWQLLGCVAGTSDTTNATLDLVWKIMSQLDKSGAMVYRCDFDYEKPDGKRMRTVDEKVSFVSTQLAGFMEVPSFADSACGTTITEDVEGVPRLRRVYRMHDDVCEVFPYAALFDSERLKLHVHVHTLFAYYRQTYRDIKALLSNWHTALCSENGGWTTDRVTARKAIPHDSVYGTGEGLVFTETPPVLKLKGRHVEHSHVRMRVRRLRFGESLDTNGNLMDTGHMMIREYDFGNGWVVWNEQQWWSLDEHERWQRLRVDASGYLRPLGWMEGDDAPAEDHDYAELDMQRGMMPDLRSLPAPMFGW